MSLAWLKVDVLLGSIGKLAAASLLVGSLGLTGCGDDPVKSSSVSKSCTLNSDCGGGLVCSFGLCHQECAKSTDCPAGQRCVQTDSSNVCQLNDEAQCHFNTDCSDPLICAIDRQCRNQCQGDKDCLEGQTCADNVCAEPQEVTEEGGLKGAVGTGGEGGQGNSSVGGKGGSGGTGAVSTVGGDNGEGGMTTMPTCEPGGDCVPEGMPCQVGTVTCDSGVAQCAVAGPADDGTDCDKNKVCSDGVCTACKAGDTCSPDPDNVCVTGTISCANGPSCDAPTNVKAGTSCGTDQVCSAGACVACKANDVCDPPGQLCKNGKMACANGPVCAPTTSKAAGYACDTDKVCDSAAACVACVQDGACEPDGQECHKGQQDCSSGPNCVDTFAAAADGTSCTGQAAYNFCTAGKCVACQNGNPCIPANPCHKGTLNCATATPTCNDSNANATDGLVCDDNKSCISGACLTNDRTLTITSGAVADVAIDAPFAAVTAHLVDKDSKPVVGAQLTVTASAGAYAVAGAATGATGNAQISGRVGRAIDTYTFTVSAPGASAVQFTAKSVAPAEQNIFTVVNVNHLSAVSTVPGPGTISKLYGEARAVVAASDGTLYIGSYYAVFKLTPAGVLTRFAGDVNEAAGYTGDSGPATSARLNGVVGLALDEPHGLLYIADYSNNAVRVVDLASNVISTYAGGNAVSTPPYGDGGPASQAYVLADNVNVAPDGDLYVSNYYYTNRLRRVDYNDGNIYAFLTPGTCVQNGPLVFQGCGDYNNACSVAWDKNGKTFVAGQFCGGGLPGTINGIARADVDQNKNVTALTLVAGAYGAASVSEGGVATSATFGAIPTIAFDKGGNLFIASHNEQRIRRVDSLTQHITTVAGDGTAAYVGDYVLGTTSELNNPRSITFDGSNNLYFADATNLAIRSLWNMGATTALTGKLATTSGTGQTVNVDAPFASLQVKLTDSNNATVGGVDVHWRRLDLGSGLSGGGLSATTIKTASAGGAAGTSSINGRVGLAIGDYGFEASYVDLHGNAVSGSPQTFTVTSKAPASGTIFPVINLAYTNAVGGVPGPAVFATMNSYGLGVAAASDGTLYASDNCAVYKVTPRGEISLLAGTPGSCGFSGDSGPAANAKLSGAYGLALDETNGVLYIADYSNKRIRMVTLASGTIDTLAGGPTINTAPYGVPAGGGTSTDADIGNPWIITVDKDGLVYIPDYSHNRILVVDPAFNSISVWLAGNTTCVNGTVQMYSVKQFESAVRFKANGDAYVSGYLCQGINTTTTTGIMLKPTAGAVTRIAGLSAGATTENVDATGALIPYLSDFVLEANGNIVLATYQDNRIRRIDTTTGKINTIAGTGANPTAGQDPGTYVDATTALFYYPWKLAATPGGHILIGDEYTYSTRMIW